MNKKNIKIKSEEESKEDSNKFDRNQRKYIR